MRLRIDTGDRPYNCHLCEDTFSRSDILKRHFLKCSVRRGNPTGATHLSYGRNTLRKTQQATRKSLNTAMKETTINGDNAVESLQHQRPLPSMENGMSNGNGNGDMSGLGISGFNGVNGMNGLQQTTSATPISPPNSLEEFGIDSMYLYPNYQ